jgi:hypothetical protein
MARWADALTGAEQRLFAQEQTADQGDEAGFLSARTVEAAVVRCGGASTRKRDEKDAREARQAMGAICRESGWRMAEDELTGIDGSAECYVRVVDRRAPGDARDVFYAVADGQAGGPGDGAWFRAMYGPLAAIAPRPGVSRVARYVPEFGRLIRLQNLEGEGDDDAGGAEDVDIDAIVAAPGKKTRSGLGRRREQARGAGGGITRVFCRGSPDILHVSIGGGFASSECDESDLAAVTTGPSGSRIWAMGPRGMLREMVQGYGVAPEIVSENRDLAFAFACGLCGAKPLCDIVQGEVDTESGARILQEAAARGDYGLRRDAGSADCRAMASSMMRGASRLEGLRRRALAVSCGLAIGEKLRDAGSAGDQKGGARGQALREAGQWLPNIAASAVLVGIAALAAVIAPR